jgi:two-component system, NtrC family, sensor kinase
MSPEASTVSSDQSVEELRRELAEAWEQQTATAEVLAAISSSRTSPNSVFTVIAARAARLCGAYDASIFELVGNDLRLVAHHGTIAHIPIGQARLPLTRKLVVGRAILDRETIHIADLQDEADQFPEGSDFARRRGHRTIVSVPLMRSGEAIGAISVRRTEVRPFTDRQIELLNTFADQAVIAIENARLFEEVQARTRNLSEALEQQTATAEVLRVISSSPSQL